MKFKKIEDKIFFRLEKGEEVVETLKNFCKENNVKLGKIEGIGSTNKVTMGLFRTEEKKYVPKEYAGDFEISSLLGNISEKDEEVYLHLHINIANEEGVVFGGHLTSAVISATFEGIISLSNDHIDRYLSEEIGLNLWNL